MDAPTKPIITEEDIKKIAHLARLKIDEATISKQVENLSNILELIACVNDENRETTTVALPSSDVTLMTRKDVITEVNQRELLQKLAPKIESGLYLVPLVIE